MKRFTWLMMFVLITLLPAGLTMACPMCKDSIPNSDAQEAVNLPGGFNLSVYSMLVGFIATLGFSAGVIVKGVRSTNRQMANPADKPE